MPALKRRVSLFQGNNSEILETLRVVMQYSLVHTGILCVYKHTSGTLTGLEKRLKTFPLKTMKTAGRITRDENFSVRPCLVFFAAR